MSKSMGNGCSVSQGASAASIHSLAGLAQQATDHMTRPEHWWWLV